MDLSLVIAKSFGIQALLYLDAARRELNLGVLGYESSDAREVGVFISDNSVKVLFRGKMETLNISKNHSRIMRQYAPYFEYIVCNLPFQVSGGKRR